MLPQPDIASDRQGGLIFFSILHPCILKIVFNFAYGFNYAISPIRTLTTGLNMSILFILLNLDIL